MNQTKPKTHRVLETRLKPGESKTLLNGTVVVNEGSYNIRLKVITPISTLEEKSHEPKSRN